MKLSKPERESVRMKFGGLCAYCGHALQKTWHVDHKVAVERRVLYDHEKQKYFSGEPRKPELDVFENLMPSCPLCNISKATLDIESWRRWLTGHLKSLNERHSIYRLMKAYGVIVETGKPIVFHFERVKP